MMFGVDGTGAFKDEQYEREMSGSFVSRICNLNLAGGRYWRGPDAIDTFLSGPNPRTVAEVIRMTVVPNAAPPQIYAGGMGPPLIVYEKSETMRSDLKDRVFLTGYSRGGATVLDVAVLLKGYGIPVEAMFLFDSVTRSPWLSGEIIPDNVKVCYHAKRDPKTKSRQSFGNSTAKRETGVNGKYDEIHDPPFFTTHAGMGGTPWGKAGLVKPVPRVPIFYGAGAGMMYGASFQTPSMVAANMVADNPKRWADKIYEPAPDWNFTDVTVSQEAEGMQLVQDWMSRCLQKHGLRM